MLIRIFQSVEWYIWKIDLSGWFYKVKEGVPCLECLFLMFFLMWVVKLF